MRVSDLSIGSTVRITGLAPGNLAYRQRLLAMGLLPGTSFTVSRIAPLGDPIEILVRGIALSLRKDEAKLLQIEEILS